MTFTFSHRMPGLSSDGLEILALLLCWKVVVYFWTAQYCMRDFAGAQRLTKQCDECTAWMGSCRQAEQVYSRKLTEPSSGLTGAAALWTSIKQWWLWKRPTGTLSMDCSCRMLRNTCQLSILQQVLSLLIQFALLWERSSYHGKIIASQVGRQISLVRVSSFWPDLLVLRPADPDAVSKLLAPG